jgi:aspartate aminotransferase
MSEPVLTSPHDLTALSRDVGPAEKRISRLANTLLGSEILKIAGEVRALQAAGRPVCDLTVGDFNPRYFPIPERLRDGIRDALSAGETNYPPSNGLVELRDSVRRFYERRLGLSYPAESVIVAGGSRPLIYCLYLAVVDPGDVVVYPVPSWNNHHYVHLIGARGVALACGAADRFMPTAESVRPYLKDARLLALNSPLNPAGTAITEDALRGICDAVLEENAGREARGERPLYLMYDQVYWMLCFGGTHHVTPPQLREEMARYTIFVDGISKGFAATGVRVGWALGPVDVMARITTLLGHVGAWAPRAEQRATAALLDDDEAIAAYHARFLTAVQARLDRLHAGLQQMKQQGLPVDSIAPMGAIYLTMRLAPFGQRTPDGRVLETNEDIRRYVLEQAAVAMVPFQAFGANDAGWFRLSVGAVSEQDLVDGLGRLQDALRALTAP